MFSFEFLFTCVFDLGLAIMFVTEWKRKCLKTYFAAHSIKSELAVVEDQGWQSYVCFH